MALISVEEVVEAKMGPYLDSIKDPEKRKEVVQGYVDASRESIESTVKEAESLMESINTSLKGTHNYYTGSFPVSYDRSHR